MYLQRIDCFCFTELTSNASSGNDVFRDAALNADLPDQPTFSGDFSTNKGRREDAMKQLIASVPTESKDIAKMDRKYLENAIRDFSGAAGAVKASPDGMFSTLWSFKLFANGFSQAIGSCAA